MKIIDSHVHLMPDDTISAADFVNEAGACGIGVMILSNLGKFEPFPTAESIKNYNETASRFMIESAGAIKFLAYFKPLLNNWRKELD